MKRSSKRILIIISSFVALILLILCICLNYELVYKKIFTKAMCIVEDIIEEKDLDEFIDKSKKELEDSLKNKDEFYNDEKELLSIEDEYTISGQDFSVIRSRMGLSFNKFSGYRTEAYFYKYQGESTTLNFSYKCKLNKGKCKLIIISPTRDEIISSIELNEEGSTDVEINEEGTYYVRLVGEEASGDIEFNAFGPNIIYEFTHNKYNTGLYDYFNEN